MTVTPTADVHETIFWAKGDDGVVVLTMDDPAQGTNTMNAAWTASITAACDRLDAELKADPASITGVIVTSAKKTFFAGGDLHILIATKPDDAAQATANINHIKRQLRRLETFPRPVVAAVNGAALGGGLEIALACHYRIVLDAKGSELGLPEVTLGLLPGAGGITRVVRLLGIQDALLKVLLQGQRYSPRAAVEVGLAHEAVDTPDEMTSRARAWIAENPKAVAPWDVKGFKIPGGSPSTPAFAMNLPAFPANLRKQIKGAPMPAPRHILSAAIEGAQVDVDTALAIETRYLVDLLCGQVSKNMIQAFFFDLNHVNGGGSRPAGYERYAARKVAILGAGMMGAGIAYVCARAGMEVVLKDVTQAGADKGKDYSVNLCKKAVSRGKMTQAGADELLGRILPTDSPQDCAGADLVIEAVFENPELKHKVFSEIEHLVAPDAVLGSNTSSLPITKLAEGVKRAEDFIGLHFFSPADKMPLLEIIAGERTSDATLAKAFDLARQIRKTPIVVNDSMGFFTSRVIATFLDEAVAMLGEGVDPQTIEQATTQAGYPVGALAADGRDHVDPDAQDPRRGTPGHRRRPSCRGPRTRQRALSIGWSTSSTGPAGLGRGFYDYDGRQARLALARSARALRDGGHAAGGRREPARTAGADDVHRVSRRRSGASTPASCARSRKRTSARSWASASRRGRAGSSSTSASTRAARPASWPGRANWPRRTAIASFRRTRWWPPRRRARSCRPSAHERPGSRRARRGRRDDHAERARTAQRAVPGDDVRPDGGVGRRRQRRRRPRGRAHPRRAGVQRGRRPEGGGRVRHGGRHPGAAGDPAGDRRACPSRWSPASPAPCGRAASASSGRATSPSASDTVTFALHGGTPRPGSGDHLAHHAAADDAADRTSVVPDW